MNLPELRWRVRRLVGHVDAEQATDPVALDGIINEAHAAVCDVHDWTFLKADVTFTTAAGQAQYGLPSPLVDVESVSYPGAGRLIRPRTPVYVDGFDEAPDDGKPDEYVLRDPSTLELVPTPDAVYTVQVRGTKKVLTIVETVSDATAETDAPQFDETYHPAVAYLAAVDLLAEAGDDSDRADEYDRRVATFVDRMTRHYQRQHDRAPFVWGGRRSRGRHRVGYLRGQTELG